jgi:hypothetical protein
MLSLEVVGPGGSLSTALIATPYGRDASWRVSWQPATATAAYSCDRATGRSFIGWGAAGGGNGGADQFRRGRILNCLLIVNSARLFFSYLFGLFMFDIRPFSRIGSR